MQPSRIVRFLAFTAVITTFAFFTVGGALVESAVNRRLAEPPYDVSPRARERFARLFVADLHADSLLWSRSLSRRARRGHVDLPRLREGGVALQAFTIVTKVPFGINIERNSAQAPDLITWLVLAQRWPPRTWNSRTERALYQAARLRRLAHDEDSFELITSVSRLRRFVERRSRGDALVAGFLGLEGAHALDGDLANLERLFDAGVRMIAPTHFFDNEFGGSAHGAAKYGLTDLGRAMVRTAEERGILIDLAHASEATIAETLALATKPVVVSHTGVKATCDNTRNLSDDQVRAIAATGGVIGIGFWETAVCGTDAAAIARAIEHVANLVGPEHVALGSDFDGAVATPFDATGVILVVEALLERGFSEDWVAAIAGDNVRRVLESTLPQ